MSWDVFLHRFSRRYVSVDDIAADEQPLPLGALADVQAAVSSAFPGTDWGDPAWGVFDSEMGSVEFNVGREDPVQSMALHVRANEGIVEGILVLCDRLRCDAIDTSAGGFLNRSPHPAAGLTAWRAYRDQAVGRG